MEKQPPKKDTPSSPVLAFVFAVAGLIIGGVIGEWLRSLYPTTFMAFVQAGLMFVLPIVGFMIGGRRRKARGGNREGVNGDLHE